MNANCFVCAILSHGDQVNNEDIIYGRDGFIRNREIFSLFKGDVCPYLAGKPKFFIIQVMISILIQLPLATTCCFCIYMIVCNVEVLYFQQVNVLCSCM